MTDRILILDFGSQVTQLIARRVRENGVYCEIRPYSVAAGEIPAGFTLHLPYGSVKSVTGPNANPISLVGLRPYSSPLCQPTKRP